MDSAGALVAEGVAARDGIASGPVFFCEPSAAPCRGG